MPGITNPSYLHIPPGTALPELSLNAPFKVVIIAEVTVDKAWMVDVCAWLIDAGCLYIMAWGPQGSAWDDAGDVANGERHGYGEIPDNKFVVTTWHDTESIDEVFWLCRHTFHHPTVPIEQILILHISISPNPSALLKSFASQTAS